VTTVAVLGGYGTFGARVSRDLARRGHRVIVAGRDVARASALARELGGDHAGVAADVTDLGSCRRAIRGATVVAVCAGPFSTLGSTPARAALDEAVHYVDLADDREYIRRLRALHTEFVRAGRCAAYGCSSLPAVSSALAASLLGGSDPPERSRVTLFIGNANPKGAASVRAMVERLGRTAQTTEGERPVFGDPRTVPLPSPFGPRKAYTFDGPEHDLFPERLGIRAVDVRVAFELALANRGFALLARLGPRWGRRTAALLGGLAALAPRTGTSGGAVLVELLWNDGRRAARALIAEGEGQRMAAFPCALAAHDLATRADPPAGVHAPTAVLAPASLLAGLQAAGLRVVDG
jgi:Saccharopine dehydrogenase NADP binding domain